MVHTYLVTSHSALPESHCRAPQQGSFKGPISYSCKNSQKEAILSQTGSPKRQSSFLPGLPPMHQLLSQPALSILQGSTALPMTAAYDSYARQLCIPLSPSCPPCAESQTVGRVKAVSVPLRPCRRVLRAWAEPARLTAAASLRMGGMLHLQHPA